MKLTKVQGARLEAWLREHQAFFRESGMESTMAARLASEELGLEVSTGHLCHRMGPGKTIDHYWPKSLNLLRSQMTRGGSRWQVLSSMVEQIRLQLGVDPVPGWDKLMSAEKADESASST